MKRLLFSICICCVVSTDLFSQTTPVRDSRHADTRVEIVLPDTTNQYLIGKQPGLKSITVVYKKNEPYFVFLNFGHKIARSTERLHFDLAFEGDAFLLSKNYGNITFIEPKRIKNTPWPDDNMPVTLTGLTFDGDSVAFRGEHNAKIKFDPDWVVGMPAKYKGNLENVGTKIAKQLKAAGNAGVTDSTLVFQGTISKNGKLEALELVVGQASALSEITEEVLLRKDGDISTGGERYEWNAANIDRGPIESKARIYVKLEPEGKVTIKTPRVLRTFTGL